MALRGVGPECEAESLRFHGRRVTRVGPEVKHWLFGVPGCVRNRKKLPSVQGNFRKGTDSSRRKSRHIASRFAVYRDDGALALQEMIEAQDRAFFHFDVVFGGDGNLRMTKHSLRRDQAEAGIYLRTEPPFLSSEAACAKRRPWNGASQLTPRSHGDNDSEPRSRVQRSHEIGSRSRAVALLDG